MTSLPEEDPTALLPWMMAARSSRISPATVAAFGEIIFPLGLITSFDIDRTLRAKD